MTTPLVLGEHKEQPHATTKKQKNKKARSRTRIVKGQICPYVGVGVRQSIRELIVFMSYMNAF